MNYLQPVTPGGSAPNRASTLSGVSPGVAGIGGARMLVKRLIRLLRKCDPGASVVGVMDSLGTSTQAPSFQVRDLVSTIEVTPKRHDGKVVVLELADASDYSNAELDL